MDGKEGDDVDDEDEDEDEDSVDVGDVNDVELYSRFLVFAWNASDSNTTNCCFSDSNVSSAVNAEWRYSSSSERSVTDASIDGVADDDGSVVKSA